jgi:CDP-diacylglycerol--serine O-phosphatidyltransferase
MKLDLGDLPGFAVISVIYVLAIAFLMVSELPIYAGKTLGTQVTRDKVLWVFLAIVLLVTLIANFTFETLTVITLAYLALIPWSIQRYRKLDNAWNRASAERSETKAE